MRPLHPGISSIQARTSAAISTAARPGCAFASRQWSRAWYASLAAGFVTRRTLLPDSQAEWLEGWRRRLSDTRIRALECYATACLEIGGSEGPAAAAGNIVIGDRLGLYRALAEAGPLSAAELAEYTDTAERYVREWLRGQAAGHLVTYDAGTGQYLMTAAQALAFADPNGLVLPGAFQMALGCFDHRSAIIEGFRSGEGFAWGAHGRACPSAVNGSSVPATSPTW